VCALVGTAARSLPHETDNGVSTPHVANADNLSPSDVLDSDVKDEDVADAEMGESMPNENSTEVEAEPSENQVESDESANRNKSSDAGNELQLKDIRYESMTGVDSTRDDASWDILADGGIHIPIGHSEDCCIHCGKQRLPEQCPVCHRMFRSVAVHISIHSVRRLETPASLPDVEPTPEEDAMSEVTGEPSAGKVGSARVNQSHVCSDCGAVFATAKTLRAHVEFCPKVAICMVCGASCNNEASLRVHMELHMDSDTEENEDQDGNMVLREDFSCSVCDDEFGSLELLSAHMEEHIDKEHAPAVQHLSKTLPDAEKP